MNTPSLKDIFALSARVIKAANETGLTIATAESCTGGLIGAAITAIPGSSGCFKGGIIAYDNTIKRDRLNIPADILQTHGAVSQEVAHAMALNAVTLLDVDIAISVTGIAGPGGGSADKPIGTVWMGLAYKQKDQTRVRTHLHQFGDIGRNKVRDVTCFEALKSLADALV